MNPEQGIDELDAYRDALEAKVNSLKDQLSVAQAELQATDRVLDGYRKWRSTGSTAIVVEFPSELNVTAEQLKDCPSIRKALELIAENNAGIVHARTAARMVMDAGLTTIDDINVATSSVYGRMHGSHDWEYDSPGTFRYLPFSQSTEPILVTKADDLAHADDEDIFDYHESLPHPVARSEQIVQEIRRAQGMTEE